MTRRRKRMTPTAESLYEPYEEYADEVTETIR